MTASGPTPGGDAFGGCIRWLTRSVPPRTPSACGGSFWGRGPRGSTPLASQPWASTPALRWRASGSARKANGTTVSSCHRPSPFRSPLTLTRMKQGRASSPSAQILDTPQNRPMERSASTWSRIRKMRNRHPHGHPAMGRAVSGSDFESALRSRFGRSKACIWPGAIIFSDALNGGVDGRPWACHSTSFCTVFSGTAWA